MNELHQKVLIESGLISPTTSSNFRVAYGNIVLSGQQLDVASTLQQPSVSWDAPPDQFYCLVMSDPHVPQINRQLHRDYLHWLVVNIKGNDLQSGNVLQPYEGPSPPKNSGVHRYIFALIKQSELYDGATPSRGEFNFQQFFISLGGSEFADIVGDASIEHTAHFWIPTNY